MRLPFPGKRGSLGSAEATLRPGLDLVELWKTRVREKLARQAELAGPVARLTMLVDSRVVLFAAAFGLVGGPLGALRSLILVLSILLVDEGSRAALARGLGRSCRVSITLAGGRTEMGGPALRGATALGFVLVGCVANVVVALALYALSRHMHGPAMERTLRELSTGHALWGIAQALPLLPFRAGTELARRLSPSLRSGHAIASGGLAVGAIFAIFKLPTSPLLLVALVFVALSSLRAAREAFAAEFDRQRGVDARLDESRAELATGNPRRALEMAQSALQVARSVELRGELWSSFAWAAIGSRDPFAAHAALQSLPEARVDVHLLASYLYCCNRNLESQELLEHARRLGLRSAETSKLLIEVLFAQGDRAGALAVTETDAALLSQPDRRLVRLALTDRGGCA